MPSNDRSSNTPPRLGEVRPERIGVAASSHGPHGPQLYPPDAHRYRRLRARTGVGGFLIYGFLILAGLVAVGLGMLVLAPPVDLVRSQMAAAIERQTGRKLTIGSAGVSFASGLGVSLGRVSLSSPPAMPGAPFLAADRIEVSLALLPLVMRDIRVERLTLVRPTLDLRIDAEGRRSWEFASHGDIPPRPLRYAQASPAKPSGSSSDASRLPPEVVDFMRNAAQPTGSRAADVLRGLEALSLADVRIVGGRLRYTDDRSGHAREFGVIEAQVSLPSTTGPLTIQGHVSVAGERMAVDLRLDRISEFLQERTVSLRARLDGKATSASFDGKVSAGAQPLGEGAIALKSPSATAAALLLGLPLAGLDDWGAVALEGRLRATGSSLMLTSATFAAGTSAGSGTLGIERDGERPRLTANLRFTELDLDRISALSWTGPTQNASEASGSAGRFAAPAVAPRSRAEVNPPRTIDELLERQETAPAAANPATRVRGFRKRAGNQWDVDTIDAAPLRAFDADARLHVDKLHSSKLEATNLQAGIELKAGVLRLSITDGQMAGGTLRGLASIDARKPALTVGANVSGDGLAVRPLLALAGVDLIDGRGRIVIAVSAEGGSERELVSTLAGRAEVKVADGALVGWDADAALAGLGQGRMPPTERRPEARTPFTELSGNFNITHGVARTRDLRLDGRTLAATGTGTVNIVDRNIDFLLKSRMASGGIEVPVRIAGGWDNPSIVPDVTRVLDSPQAKEAVRHLKDGNVDGALRSVLGNGPKADKQIERAKDLLKGFLKQ